MSGDSYEKRIKTDEGLSFFVPEDVVQNILSFFPIKDAIKSSLMSRDFKNSWLFCRDLDFGGDFGKKRTQSEAIEIIKNVFEQNEASKIKRLALSLSCAGVQDLLESWIVRCLDKGLEELELDLISSVFVIQLSINFSAIQSLRVLKLCLVEFHMPSASKGLKLLRTLSLSRISVTEEMIAAVFKNCLLLENLELVGCDTIRELKIYGRNHKRFTSLGVTCCPAIGWIHLDAPTLESFTYSGLISLFTFGYLGALKDVMLHFVKFKNFSMAFSVINLLDDFAHIGVFTTSNVFLEGLTKRCLDGNLIEIPYSFYNLREFQLLMESHTYCNLFDIADFIKNCPRLERIYIDLNNFTFEVGLYWELHQKPLLHEFPYKLSSIKFVEIKGFKNHWHELDIVQFFLEKSPNLDKIALVTPMKRRAKVFKPDLEKIQALRALAPRVTIAVHEHARYKSKAPPNHLNRWSF